MPPELIRVAELPSTMEAAHLRAQQGAPHGTTIVADRQSAGRGTRGRAWSSEPGGLWLSVVAHPSRVDALEALSLRIGLAVADALELACPELPQLAIKWPNDIVVGERKLAGILCEARWGGGRCLWIVVGVGVNVANTIPPTLQPAAVALREWCPTATPQALALPVATAVDLAAREAGPLTDGELQGFARRDAMIGRAIALPTAGTADGITPAGALRVRTGAGSVQEVLAGVVAVPR